jgi:hypothetical protein
MSNLIQVLKNSCRWIAVRAEALGGILSGIIAFWLVYGQSRTSSAVGFTIVLLNNFNRQLLMVVRQYNRLEVQANRSVRSVHPENAVQ